MKNLNINYLKKLIHNYYLSENKQLHKDLEQAIKNRELYLNYQPKINLNTQKIEGVEALLRWKKDDKNIPPLLFIEYAEKSGLIQRITYYVLQKAFKDLNNKVNIAFNIPATLLTEDFVATVKKLIKHYKINTNLITFEILEHSIIEDFETAITIINRLKKIGIKISIDDFGTGYSSLLYIKKIQADQVKIDKNFVDNIANNEEEEELIKCIINFINDLNFEVVAEGVETQQQADILKKYNCKTAQGYFYHKPLSLENLKKILEVQKDD